MSIGAGCDKRPGGVRRVGSAQVTVARANPSTATDREAGVACRRGVRITNRPQPMWRPKDRRWARIWCAEELIDPGARVEGVRVTYDTSAARWPGDCRGNGSLMRERTAPMAWPGARGYPASVDPVSGKIIDYANVKYGGNLSTKPPLHPDVVRSRESAIAAETVPNESMKFRHAGEYYY
eukprot:scaffold8287_cov36-Tisochrysis_lutea.AAC.5